jgi:hypothetical protein
MEEKKHSLCKQKKLTHLNSSHLLEGAQVQDELVGTCPAGALEQDGEVAA